MCLLSLNNIDTLPICALDHLAKGNGGVWDENVPNPLRFTVCLRKEHCFAWHLEGSMSTFTALRTTSCKRFQGPTQKAIHWSLEKPPEPVQLKAVLRMSPRLANTCLTDLRTFALQD